MVGVCPTLYPLFASQSRAVIKACYATKNSSTLALMGLFAPEYPGARISRRSKACFVQAFFSRPASACEHVYEPGESYKGFIFIEDGMGMPNKFKIVGAMCR